MANALHQDLLHLARRVARMDPRRPRQVSLRCALSRAYYALFHFLVDQSSRHLAGSTGERERRRRVLARAYAHGEMLAVCDAFSRGRFPTLIGRLNPNLVVPQPIQVLAGVFRQLQLQRHLADYDLEARFSREEVLDFIEEVQTAIQQFRAIRDDPAVRLFLVCLPVWDRVRTK